MGAHSGPTIFFKNFLLAKQFDLASSGELPKMHRNEENVYFLSFHRKSVQKKIRVKKNNIVCLTQTTMSLWPSGQGERVVRQRYPVRYGAEDFYFYLSFPSYAQFLATFFLPSQNKQFLP